MNEPTSMDPSLNNALPPGTRLAEFEIKDVLGVGGFGIVYRAFDHALEREVALKEYMPTSMAGRTETMQVSLRSQSNHEVFSLGLASFVNEAKLLARFDHPALLKVYRFWQANGTAYMAMPILHGQTLKDVRQGLAGPPDEAWMRALLLPLLEALDILHSQGVYHRDIAPDNIKIEADGHPVLLDFGAARRVITDKTQALTAILKPSYAPIEQYAEAGSVRQGAWTDLYSLGATMHYLLLGHPPAPATTRAVQDEQAPLAQAGVAGYGTALLALIDWMLAPRPSDRPQNVAQVRAALLGEAAAGASPMPRSTRDAETTQIVPRTGPAAIAKPGAPAWGTTHAPQPTAALAGLAATGENTATGQTGATGAPGAWQAPPAATVHTSSFTPTVRQEAVEVASDLGAPAPVHTPPSGPQQASPQPQPQLQPQAHVGKTKSVPVAAVAASVLGLVVAAGWWAMRPAAAPAVGAAASAPSATTQPTREALPAVVATAAAAVAASASTPATSPVFSPPISPPISPPTSPLTSPPLASTQAAAAAAAGTAMAPPAAAATPSTSATSRSTAGPSTSHSSSPARAAPAGASAAGTRGQASQTKPNATTPNGKTDAAKPQANTTPNSGSRTLAPATESARSEGPQIQRGTPNDYTPSRPAPAPSPAPAAPPAAAAPRPAPTPPVASAPAARLAGPKAACADMGTFRRLACMESQCSGEARSHPDCVVWFRAQPDASRR